MWLIPFGVLAGMLTTLAGMGGGILLQVLLALVVGPHTALVITAPALLVGNAHRAFLYRRHVDARVAKALVLGALPGSLLGGLCMVVLPTWAMQTLILATVVLAVARHAGVVTLRPTAAWLTPASAAMGAVSATSGGAGLLLSPLALSTGLTGERYVATVAVVSVSMHIGRIGAYSVGGLFRTQTLIYGIVLTVTILVGNMFGARLRTYLPDTVIPRIELGVLCVTTLLALVGVAR